MMSEERCFDVFRVELQPGAMVGLVSTRWARNEGAAITDVFSDHELTLVDDARRRGRMRKYQDNYHWFAKELPGVAREEPTPTPPPTCATCRFWGKIKLVSDEKDDCRICHRYPPAATGHGSPTPWANEWCGEYAAKETI